MELFSFPLPEHNQHEENQKEREGVSDEEMKK